MRLIEQFEDVAERLMRFAEDYYGASLITFAVYGSVARGTATIESDLDLLVVASNLPNGRMPRIDAFTQYVEERERMAISCQGKTYPVRVSTVLKTPEEVQMGSLLFLDMTEQVSILFDREDFFTKYLERLREKMREWGTEKRYSGGGYYWLLKPNLKPGEKIDL